MEGITAAEFFVTLNKKNETFDRTLFKRYGKTFYQGDIRLNVYLQMAQVIYIAKTGAPLIHSSFYAYEIGAVIPAVSSSYSRLIGDTSKESGVVSVNNDERLFLEKIDHMFQNATMEILIELSQEDPAWIEKHNKYREIDKIMDFMAHVKEYEEQYAELIAYMEK